MSAEAADVVRIPVAVRAPAGPPGPGPGRTTIADRVYEQLASRMSLDVPGVVPYSAGPEMLSRLTSSLPSASVESAGDRIRLQVQLAVVWEAQAVAVAAEVRRQVRERLERETGKTVDRVDVTVAKLVPADQGRQARRVE